MNNDDSREGSCCLYCKYSNKDGWCEMHSEFVELDYFSGCYDGEKVQK